MSPGQPPVSTVIHTRKPATICKGYILGLTRWLHPHRVPRLNHLPTMTNFDFSSQVLPLPPPSAHIPHPFSHHRTPARLMVFSSTQAVDHPPFLNLVDSKMISMWQGHDADLAPRLTTIDMNVPRQSIPLLAGATITEPPKAMLAPAAHSDGSFTIKRERVRYSAASGNENRTSDYQEHHKNMAPKMNMKIIAATASSLPLGVVPTDHRSGLTENAQPKSDQGGALTALANDVATGDEDLLASNSLGHAPIDIEPVDEVSFASKVFDIASVLVTTSDDSCENTFTSATLVDELIEQNADLHVTKEAITSINADTEYIDNRETNEFVPPSTVLSHPTIDSEEAAERAANKSWEMKLIDEYTNDKDLSESDKCTAEEPSAAPPLTSTGADELPVATDVASSVSLDAAVTDSQTTPAPLNSRTAQTHSTRHVNQWQLPYRRAGPRPSPDLSYVPPPRRRHDHRRIMQEMMEAMEKAGLEEQRRAEAAARRATAAAAARKPTFKKWARSVLESIKRRLKPTKYEPSKSEIVSNVEEESKSSLKESEPAKIAPKPVILVPPMIEFTVCDYRPKSLLMCNKRLLHPTWLTQPERRRLTTIMHDGVSRRQATRDVLLVRNIGAHATESLRNLKHVSGPETDSDAALTKLVGDTRESSPTGIDSSPLENSKSSSSELHSTSSALDHHAPPFKRDGSLLHPIWLTRAERCSVVESTEKGLTRRHATRELLKARGQKAARAETSDELKDIGDADTDKGMSSKDTGDISSSCSEPDSSASSSNNAPSSNAVAIEPSSAPNTLPTVMVCPEPSEETKTKTMWTRILNRVCALFSLCSTGWRRAGDA